MQKGFWRKRLQGAIFMAGAMGFALRGRRRGRSAWKGTAGWVVLLPLLLMILVAAPGYAASGQGKEQGKGDRFIGAGKGERFIVRPGKVV